MTVFPGMCILLSSQTTTLTGSSGSMCILLSPQTTTLTGYTGSMYIVLSPQTTTLTGSGSMCILLSPTIYILPVEPVIVVVWGDNNIHILPLPVNVVVSGETTIYTYHH
jgi:hypothetical protein